ncbi:MAG TPA: hypothetical protein ENN22_11655 [bacterium]|nr:hypothetical protein [bacterium]
MNQKLTPFILAILSLSLIGFVCKEPKIRYDQTKEARGIWVTRWEWAKVEIVDNPEAQRARIIEIFDVAKRANLNLILFQVRGNGDAFYQSKFEPWSDLLTGTLGKNPNWDPLAFAVDQAHQRGMELHAWVNTFPAWRGTTPPPRTLPEHVYHAHPEWIVCDSAGTPMALSGHYVNLSPGIPAVREYVHNVCLDMAENYDIDGVHFDYIRYPENSPKLGYSQDAISLRLFNSPEGNPQNLSWADWQRENINQFVRKFYDSATRLKPWLKISAAVIGKYDYSEWNGFHVVYQDGLRWIRDGKIDFICPMIYWQTDHPTAPFGPITQDWLKKYPHQRYIFPGLSINQLGSSNWPLDELLRQVAIVREGGNGMVFFSYSGLEKAISQLQTNGFMYQANLPSMPWKKNKPPMDPRQLAAQINSAGAVKLSWSLPDSSVEIADVHRYNIFRSEKTPVDIFKAENLIHITAGLTTEFTDSSLSHGNIYYYVVTALDRVNNESPPSNEVQVSLPHLAIKSVTDD